MWNEVIYEPGVLKAVAYKDGEKLGESFMITTGDAAELRLTADRDRIKADGKDLSYVLIELLDENGYACPFGSHEIQLEIDEPGEIKGAGNGDPRSLPLRNLSKVNLFYGKAMVIVSAAKRGRIDLKASAEGLESQEIRIKAE
jgi:beta-galactosidase